MATTRLMPLHIGKGRDISTAIADVIDYVENPQKTDFGKFIYGYECDTRIADAEFLLSKRQYFNQTGRSQGADDVIAYHLRQAFKPGEVTPEEANQIGRELALKLTKGNHAFVVCTHIDKHHVHNHIIINSTTLDCQKKFRNFWGSTWAIRRMNDKLCLEHGLSIVEDPKPSRTHYGTWLGSENQPSFQEQIRRAIDAAMEEKPKDFEELLKKLEAVGIEINRERKHLRFRVPGQEKYTRCDTLKGDYTEQAIKERIAGTRTVKPRRTAPTKPVSKVGLLVDIEAAIRAGKGPGYERWAKVFNLKQLSQAVIYLKEHGNMSYEDLQERTSAVTDRFNALSTQIKDMESRMTANGELQKQIVNYVKTRAVYIEYRKAGYSKKFRSEHEAEILLHQAAKKHFDSLGITKLPSVKSLREEYAGLLEQKRKTYAAYKQARAEMKELHNVKANVDYLLEFPAGQEPQRDMQKSRQ
ncbi:relaxase/mobilization nuclease domain-containing protein [Massilicoli timonensis]|uniref:relaxase/mobilization nuclease domain-containing protein n=1 Tax=Massilicoli timonensis TaxID=2015901 RepID=UPI000C84FBDC|nr:relaxase/mobilization nuclease domain-containing protein [Massilicoli timonensis]